MRAAAIARAWGLILALAPLTRDVSATGPVPPFVVDCGSGEERERELHERLDGAVLPDRPWTETRGYGHIGGRAERTWYAPVRGDWQNDLFATGRAGDCEYRFDLPAGEYVVAVGLCELRWHAAGRRVFDLEIQGEVVAAGVDPFEVAGHSRAFRLYRRARVEESGTLRIRARGRVGEPIVRAIGVYPDLPTATPPPPPASFRATAGYGCVILRWLPPVLWSTRGVVLERRSPERGTAGEFIRVGPAEVAATRWIDRSAPVGAELEYRAAALGHDGRLGPWTPVARVRALDLDDATLSVWSIEASAVGLEYLLEDVHEERTIRATLHDGQRAHPIEMRLRGASTRLAAKPSWRVRFLESVPDDSTRVTYLKAEPTDPTMLQERLSCDIFDEIALPVSRTRWRHLVLNGVHQGLWLEIEPIRSPFKERASLDPKGTLIRSRAGFEHIHEEEPGELRGRVGSVDELRELIRRANRVDRGELAAFIRHATDWPLLRDYYVAQLLCHRSEIEANDSFWHRDSRTGKWVQIPWDHNNGNFGIGFRALRPGEPFLRISGMSLQNVGAGHPWWYVIPTRAFHDETLRRDWLERVEELTCEILLSERFREHVETRHEEIRAEALPDWRRWPTDRDDVFLESPRTLVAFARAHGRSIFRQLTELREERLPLARIDEFRFGAGGGHVEVRNLSGETLSLDGWTLGDLESRSGRWRFPPDATLEPHGLLTVEVPHDPLPPPVPRDDGDHELEDLDAESLDTEELERRELAALEAEERRRRHVAGFSPDGGTIGLFAPPEARHDETDDEHREREGESHRGRLVDFWFFGPQHPHLSYGRTASGGYGFLEPSFGAANGEVVGSRPHLLTNGGVSWSRGAVEIRARLEPFGDTVDPRAVTAFVDLAGSGPTSPIAVELTRREDDVWSARVPTPEGVESLRFWLRARGEDGLERRGPDTAPLHRYRAHR